MVEGISKTSLGIFPPVREKAGRLRGIPFFRSFPMVFGGASPRTTWARLWEFWAAYIRLHAHTFFSAGNCTLEYQEGDPISVDR